MSGLLRLNAADFLRGFITAVLTAGLTSLQQFISTSGTITPINWKLVGGVASASAIGYLLKNLLTAPDGKVLGITATAGPPPAHDQAPVHDDMAAILASSEPPMIEAALTQQQLLELMHARDRLSGPKPAPKG